jgi:ParB family chromosome partitioning protein
VAQKPALGKGLASLFPGVSQPPPQPPFSGAPASGLEPPQQPRMEASNRDRVPAIAFASLEDIVVNEYQPRRDFQAQPLEELAQSIRENGIIQPLIVRKTPQGYQLIAGERRLRAARLVGLKQVPIVIRRSTDREALELALIENIQRENLNCVDEALAYFQLMQDFSLTQEEVARRVGKERTTVANHLRLLRLPEAILDDLKRGILSLGHGKALLSVEDNELRLRARKEIVERKLSVRDTETLLEELRRRASAPAGAMAAGAPQPVESGPVQSRLAKIAQELTHHWSTRVEMKGNDRRGKIVIHYASREDLERILSRVQN